MPLIAGLLAAISTLLTLRLLVLIGAAAAHLLRWKPPAPGPLPPLAVLVPAFNEERVLEGTVRSLLASDHPDFEVIVVDDGSKDRTAEIARSLAALPRVKAVILERNGGKSAALNAGVAATDRAHLVTVDADTVLLPDTLRRLAERLGEPGVDAVAANVKVGNRTRWLTRWQSLEYIIGLNLHRRALATLGCITTIPGAACAVRRDAVLAVGGWSADTVVEDTDLTLALLEARKRIVFEPFAVALTEAPDTVAGLFRQRTRWARGYLQCLWKHRRSFLRPDALGLFGLPDLLLVNVLFYLLIPASLPGVYALLTPVGPWGFVAGLVSFVWLDMAIAAATIRVDREDSRDLIQVPLRRLLWPWFLLVVFLVALGRTIRRSTVWGQPARRGALADTTRDGAPDILR